MKTLTRTLFFAIIAIAATCGLLGGAGHAAAANGYEQWTVDSAGCYAYWDGYGYTLTTCPRTDGGFDFYAADSGSWVLMYSAGYMADGNIWLIYGGVTYISQTRELTAEEQLFPDGLTIGGGSWSGTTGNTVVDQIMFDSNQAQIDILLSPNCVYTDSQYCYVN